MIVTQPTGMTMHDWADRVVLDLDSQGSFGKLADENWQNWAAQFLSNPSLPANLPNPYAFNNWQIWADRFCGDFL